MSQVQRIQIPRSLIDRIPPPVVDTLPPPVVSGISPPVINIPNPVIDYPTLDAPTQQRFEESVQPPSIPDDFLIPSENKEEELNREVSTPEVPRMEAAPIVTQPPPLTIPGTDIPLPPTTTLAATGATAVVATSVTLMSNIVFSKVKEAFIEPAVKRMGARKKKIKIKQVKPVLHYVMDDDGKVDIYQYTQKGTKMIDTVDDIERYIRDKVEDDALYEYDNKIIIDDTIKDKFTKEGAKRFKRLFAPAKTIARKLGASFSF
jgi:hypothetical protein